MSEIDYVDYIENCDIYENCPICNEFLDSADFDFQTCSICGWDSDNNKNEIVKNENS